MLQNAMKFVSISNVSKSGEDGQSYQKYKCILAFNATSGLSENESF